MTREQSEYGEGQGRGNVHNFFVLAINVYRDIVDTPYIYAVTSPFVAVLYGTKKLMLCQLKSEWQVRKQWKCATGSLASSTCFLFCD